MVVLQFPLSLKQPLIFISNCTSLIIKILLFLRTFLFQSLYWNGYETYRTLIQSVGSRLGPGKQLLLRQEVCINFLLVLRKIMGKKFYGQIFLIQFLFSVTSFCVENAKEAPPVIRMTVLARKVAKPDGPEETARHPFVVREVLTQLKVSQTRKSKLLQS